MVSSGARLAELRYKAWGETRYTWGTTPTAYRFTGQREESTIGLYFYNARWYDPVIGRFLQPDTIMPEPGNPQAPYTNRAANARITGVRHSCIRVSFVDGHHLPHQTWDEENRLKTVTVNGQTTTYVYDGDGRRVKKVQGGQTTVYIGNYYEKNLSTGVVTKYYYAGGQRVAQRQGSTV